MVFCSNFLCPCMVSSCMTQDHMLRQQQEKLNLVPKKIFFFKANHLSSSESSRRCTVPDKESRLSPWSKMTLKCFLRVGARMTVSKYPSMRLILFLAVNNWLTAGRIARISSSLSGSEESSSAVKAKIYIIFWLRFWIVCSVIISMMTFLFCFCFIE